MLESAVLRMLLRVLLLNGFAVLSTALSHYVNIWVPELSCCEDMSVAILTLPL